MFSIVVLLFLNIVILMRIRSVHFKKEFDLNKAELVGKGTFAEVSSRPCRSFASSIRNSTIRWQLERSKRARGTSKTSPKRN